MMQVKDVMSTSVECVKPTDQVTHARSLIRDKRLRILPVCDGRRLVGLLSRGDVLKVTSTKANITIEGIMHTNIVSVMPGDSLLQAAQKIADSNVLYLPVVDGDSLKGVLSSRKVLNHIVENTKKTDIKVSDVMTSDVVTCSPDDDLSWIWDKMIKSGLGGLPVVEKGVVKGMVTKMDLLNRGSARLVKESGKGKKIHVKKVMKSPPHVLGIGKTVAEAASMMIENKITRLPIVDGKNKLVGIIDVEDVFNAYLS